MGFHGHFMRTNLIKDILNQILLILLLRKFYLPRKGLGFKVTELSEFITKHIKDSEFQLLNIDDVSGLLKERLGDSYDSQTAYSVKQVLVEHDKIDFFKEGTYIYQQKFYYCIGTWLCYKGVYENPVQAKQTAKIVDYEMFDEE